MRTYYSIGALAASLLVAGLIASCTPGSGGYDTLASGKVLHVSKQGFTLQNNTQFVFVRIEGASPALSRLRKGDQVTLLGHESKTPGNETIAAVVLEDGTRISLE